VNNYNPNIHHRKSIRLKGYDYSKAGLYYITICTDDRKCLFGKIVPVGVQNIEPLQSINDSEIIQGVQNFEPLRQEMILNDSGRIANSCWLQIPEHFPDAFLHEYVVMPNHIHGIIELRKSPVGVQNIEPLQSMNDLTIIEGVENFQPRRNEYQKIIPHSIGSIVRGFKIGVTKWFRNDTDIENIWQRNYYEHIIRNEKSYERIADYIIENPNNWKNDDFFK
jgi:REP element-mobilizing transposase RayT